MARDIYTADMGTPPSPDEGAPAKKKSVKKPFVRREEPEVYTADMGTPPSPDEGPTMRVRPRAMPRPMKEAQPYKAGGKVSSASKRADGIAQRGRTKGRII